MLKPIKLITAAQNVSVHVGTIIRGSQPVLRWNYKCCTTVRVGTDIVRVMEAYAAITLTFVILAKYWLWLPDDGSHVNRNVLERLL